MLRGNYLARVHAGPRIPSDFLGELRKLGSKFYVTSAKGDSALVYPMKAWERSKQARQAFVAHPARVKFLARTSYFGQVVETDGQGRI